MHDHTVARIRRARRRMMSRFRKTPAALRRVAREADIAGTAIERFAAAAHKAEAARNA